MKLGRKWLLLSIEVDLEYKCENPCDFLLQIEAAQNEHQSILEEKFETYPDQILNRSHAEDGIGTRMWLHVEEKFKCTYQAKIELKRDIVNLEEIQQCPLAQIRGEAIKYLMPSRYCHLEKFEAAIPTQFSNLSGGKLVAALCDWIKCEFTYAAGASDTFTTAYDTLKCKQGVCRDYAHVLICLLRVSGIPARIVSAYAPGVKPQDFHALVQVYLERTWYLVDPTGMTAADEIAVIGVGRDAADISFLTSYGFTSMTKQSVNVNIIEKTTR